MMDPQKPWLHNLIQTRAAAQKLSKLSAQERSDAILSIAKALENHYDAILLANDKDLSANPHLDNALKDRLILSGTRFKSMVDATRAIAAQHDPIGACRDHHQHPNGLIVQKMKIPLGVIMMIYESRPNVTVDAAALCLRSANAVVLRGGGEAWHSNRALRNAIHQGLRDVGLPPQCVYWVEEQNRALIAELLQQNTFIDLVIPRGGVSLIKAVTEQSRIPVIQHYQGICHIYVDKDAHLDMAQNIVMNAKTQRPGVCNAVETLLLHSSVAEDLLKTLGPALHRAEVEVFADAPAKQSLRHAKLADDSHYATEFLSLKLAVKTVDDLDQAMAHIARFGSHHTASIITQNTGHAETFLSQVDASCVLHNASTRFNDGGELGLGAEMGISTTKLHAYGPMGADSLTTEKFVVRGAGQVRS